MASNPMKPCRPESAGRHKEKDNVRGNKNSCDLWGAGIDAMMLGSAYASHSNNNTVVADYRQQPTGITYAYQDATGQYTVYVRGTKRTAYDSVDYLED
ncbi:MAG: hypothetical protein VCB77_06850 [Alphaproteobacteria bacterium]